MLANIAQNLLTRRLPLPKFNLKLFCFLNLSNLIISVFFFLSSTSIKLADVYKSLIDMMEKFSESREIAFSSTPSIFINAPFALFLSSHFSLWILTQSMYGFRRLGVRVKVEVESLCECRIMFVTLHKINAFGTFYHLTLRKIFLLE